MIVTQGSDYSARHFWWGIESGSPLSFGGSWVICPLLISANILIHVGHRHGSALQLILLAWQMLALDSARITPDLLCNGTVMSHSGPAAAVFLMLGDLCVYWFGPVLLTLSILPFMFRRAFRKAVREHRWLVSATALGLLNFLFMAGGVSLALMRSR